ncbi:betaine/proline/choline family ABC transporter ATP-binding protein [Terribacillus saccharophilus]|uniref:Quaternary amine transport ATP-binding protein n=2 Tax=Terribacillus saccharophilus TaxID=361277 RepID=A0A075LLU1_9BACI|nr:MULTISPECIES: betaine/proline/choline family ABC transporter ATP-binding protein [Terribacillus]AIF67324.1 glycine/betaine ABC transporter ATP-binding protein [Terribacillus goriensis]MCM3226971.1 betaine/proline/choline family ABC transporter ATP-binding protein [Terribacillus saccharophilus]MEC0284364.1 betaine/proline/choline family ABC transporter ATP-binding protein [Terribacillus saccharophilus]MEC0291042.1 betaine/proline/choline family ABC transporter ATP-binding protein [Terribacill
MLTFENVTKIYSGSKKAVNNLNLQIEKGEFICFIGPSGCGKTTSMKMVNRLIEPSEGRILIDGKDIMKQNRVQMRREIGYVIQQIGLFPHMTISENITLVPKLLQWSKEKRRERAVELIKLVNLPEEYLDRYPQELSGGQQQRIGVLRALASNPPLILMDEPFGALDPITRDGLQEEFKDLQKRLGKTIVFVTHDMDEAIKLADRIVIMKDGEIVQVDTPDEILRNPANEFVESFIGKERLIQTKPDVTTVGQIMNKIPATVHKEETLSTAIQRMKEKRVDSLLVIGDDQTLEGYIDVEDIEENRKKSTLVGEIYETELYKVKEDSLIRDTIQKMLRRHTKYVPVVDDQNKLKGIVTRATLADLVYDSIWGDEDDN